MSDTNAPEPARRTLGQRCRKRLARTRVAQWWINTAWYKRILDMVVAGALLAGAIIAIKVLSGLPWGAWLALLVFLGWGMDQFRGAVIGALIVLAVKFGISAVLTGTAALVLLPVFLVIGLIIGVPAYLILNRLIR